jgi:phage terminase large subunit GpA-like protein
MMDVITDPMVEEVTVMKCVRSGGTQAVINNAIGYWIDQDPGPMLLVQTGIADAKTWSKDHFDTMVRDTPCLREKVSSDKIKDRKNEILHKTFPGGLLYIVGSNSAAGFRMKTIQRVLLDDIDGYEVSAGNEGDQIALARNRTITYMHHGRKIIKVSNPTTRGLSRIEREFNQSDQRIFFLPCPHCGHFQFLVFSKDHSQFAHLANSQLMFDSANLSWVYYQCENCKKSIEERHKIPMVRAGRWQAQRPDVTHHAGFHLSEMFSPFSSWHQLAKDFLEQKRYREQLRTFINQRLGETFVEDRAYELDDDDLMTRVEKYPTIQKADTAIVQVPEGVLVMTVATDTQADRLESIVMGWGLRGESWIIDRHITYGSPERDATYEALDEYLSKVWMHETGLRLTRGSRHGIAAELIDAGYATENVYRYVKRHQRRRRILAIKGDDGMAKGFIPGGIKYEKRLGARFALVGVDAIKVRLFDRLNVRKAGPNEHQEPGLMHFPEHVANHEFFEQLTAEKRIRILDKRSGFYKAKWVLKEGRRNEVLDCVVYNIAAETWLKPVTEPRPTKKQRPPRTGGGFLDSWRR